MTQRAAGVAACRVCGCTDLDCRLCIQKTGAPCHWVKPDLCSACTDLDIDQGDELTAEETAFQDETLERRLVESWERGMLDLRLFPRNGAAAPIPMELSCPKCHLPHVDKPDPSTGIDWSTRPHKTHLCGCCGHEWRPAEYATVGVAQMPDSSPSLEELLASVVAAALAWKRKAGWALAEVSYAESTTGALYAATEALEHRIRDIKAAKMAEQERSSSNGEH